MLISTGAGQFDIQSLVSFERCALASLISKAWFRSSAARWPFYTPLLSTGHRPIQITPIWNVSSRIYKTPPLPPPPYPPPDDQNDASSRYVSMKRESTSTCAWRHGPKALSLASLRGILFIFFGLRGIFLWCSFSFSEKILEFQNFEILAKSPNYWRFTFGESWYFDTFAYPCR